MGCRELAPARRGQDGCSAPPEVRWTDHSTQLGFNPYPWECLPTALARVQDCALLHAVALLMLSLLRPSAEAVTPHSIRRSACTPVAGAPRELPCCRPMARDGINRSFLGVFSGSRNPRAAEDGADRLHLVLQREDAVVAWHSGG